MSKKQTNNYFTMLAELAEYPYQAAMSLDKILRAYNPDNIKTDMENLHKVEHDADNAKHELMRRLAKEFITPIEREDIIELAQKMDDVTDAVEDILIHLYMYNIKTIRDDVFKLLDLIVKSCDNLRGMMEEFRNFRKSLQLHQRIVTLNRLESEGDSIYYEAVRRLFVEEKDAVAITGWSRAFSHIEHCLDACENMSEAVEAVVMKNT